MLLGSIFNIPGSLLGLGGSKPTVPPASTQPAPILPAPISSVSPPPGDSGGLAFDFSEDVLASLDNPAATNGPAPAPAHTAEAPAPTSPAIPASAGSAAGPVTRPGGTLAGPGMAVTAETASDTPARRTEAADDTSGEDRMRAWAIGMLKRERLAGISLVAEAPAGSVLPGKSLARESANLNNAPKPQTLTRA